MAGWIKVPLGMEVGLGSGDIVLDGDPAPHKMKHIPSTFRPMSIVVKRLDGGTWYGGRLRPRPHSARRGPSSPFPRKGHSNRHFSAHVYCGQRSPISGTAEFLLIPTRAQQ